MKKRLVIGAVFSFFIWSPNLKASCQAGGPGSTSCSVSKTFELGAGPASGSTTITYETSCGPGYYSCCNLNILSGAGSATCIQSPSIAP
jgi:hypothetical protein